MADKFFLVVLEVINGPMDGEVFIVRKERFNLGRDSENDISLPYDGKIKKAGHVVFEPGVNGNWVVKNAARRNVSVDGNKVSGEATIEAGQLIKVGNTLLAVNELS